jgi:fructose-1,6-bisphosphatase/inositol monophosphatase family enzyme
VVPTHPLLEPIRALHRRVRREVMGAGERQSISALAAVAEEGPGDTLYAIDRVSEALLVEELGRAAERVGGVVLIAEGLSGGLALPAGRTDDRCRYRVLVDPIDGTRGLMYQKRPAWMLTGVAPNRGPDTCLSDIELAVQTELPLVKQFLADELWAFRGQGAWAERSNLLTGERCSVVLRPSRSSSIQHGFATVCRFFPGVRDELAAIDEEVVRALLGPPPAGKARCFEDQYASTGGQLYELLAGHDRWVADLRPLMAPIARARGLSIGLCCHPYDLCTALIAEELGVIVRDPWGNALEVPMTLDVDVAWVGYANHQLAERIQPILRGALERRGLRPGIGPGEPDGASRGH